MCRRGRLAGKQLDRAHVRLHSGERERPPEVEEDPLRRHRQLACIVESASHRLEHRELSAQEGVEALITWILVAHALAPVDRLVDASRPAQRRARPNVQQLGDEAAVVAALGVSKRAVDDLLRLRHLAADERDVGAQHQCAAQARVVSGVFEDRRRLVAAAGGTPRAAHPTCAAR